MSPSVGKSIAAVIAIDLVGKIDDDQARLSLVPVVKRFWFLKNQVRMDSIPMEWWWSSKSKEERTKRKEMEN